MASNINQLWACTSFLKLQLFDSWNFTRFTVLDGRSTLDFKRQWCAIKQDVLNLLRPLNLAHQDCVQKQIIH